MRTNNQELQLETYYKRLKHDFPLPTESQKAHDDRETKFAAQATAFKKAGDALFAKLKKQASNAPANPSKVRPEDFEERMLGQSALSGSTYPHRFSNKKRINKKRLMHDADYRSAYYALRSKKILYPAKDRFNLLWNKFVDKVYQYQLLGNLSYDQVLTQLNEIDIQDPFGHMLFFHLVEPRIDFIDLFSQDEAVLIKGSPEEKNRGYWAYEVTKLLAQRPEVAFAYSFLLEMISEDFATSAKIYGNAPSTVKETHWLASKLRYHRYNASIMLFLAGNLPYWDD